MTAVDFDPTTGRLRLTAEAFEGLAADDPRMAEEFTAAGVRGEKGFHPLLKPGLAAVRGPVCEVAVQVAGAFAVHHHRGWISGEAAAFLLQSTPDRWEFLTVGPTFAPAGLAHVLRLGPRPRRGLPEVPWPDVDSLFDESAAVRTTEAERFIEALGVDAAESGWRASRTLVVWPGPDDAPAGRDLVLFDHPAGVAEHRADPPRWVPSTVTDVWARLVALLPVDEELVLDARS
ncbi:MAG: hypothetical protein ACT4QG_06875 [Sporichthyaceae bacterium]